MAIDLDTQPVPIDPGDPQLNAMLTNLQGNILKGHGRDHTVHIFIKLNGNDQASERKRLGEVAERFVTSALRQHRESEQFRQFGIPGSLFGNLFLTKKGYVALGFENDVEAKLPDPLFLGGMPGHAPDFNDPEPAKWEKGYKDGEIDAMLLLADDDVGFLLRQARAAIAELEEFSTVLAAERGDALRTDSGEGIEHFGYVDGRSQPIYFETDLENEGKTDKWNPVEKLKIVLVPDKLVGDEDAFGSYFVFRKLEQDVRRFKMREQDLADGLGMRGKGREERDRAGALAVGRFEDGTPLTLSQTDGFIPLKDNNFTYGADQAGLKCPFHAHIRKCNPRGDTAGGDANDQGERSRRITRRGITYGERNRHPDAFQALEDLPTEGVGLLFMCFQSSIENQFAFMQSAWVNNPGFARPLVIPGTPEAPDTGLDPVIGQGPKSEQHWPVNWGGPEMKDFEFSGFVTMKGGEFFFAPSIPFLRGL